MISTEETNHKSRLNSLTIFLYILGSIELALWVSACPSNGGSFLTNFVFDYLPKPYFFVMLLSVSVYVLNGFELAICIWVLYHCLKIYINSSAWGGNFILIIFANSIYLIKFILLIFVFGKLVYGKL